jgi:hypothetical protein
VFVPTDPSQVGTPPKYLGSGDLILPVSISRTFQQYQQVLCQVDSTVTVTLLDAKGHSVAALRDPYRTRFIVPEDAYNPSLQGLQFDVVWANWCGEAGDYQYRIEVGTLTVTASLDRWPLPVCHDRTAASTLTGDPIVVGG